MADADQCVARSALPKNALCIIAHPGHNLIVSGFLPFVTIIIPTRPGQDEIAALEASRALDYPKDRLEIIVARGRQPAAQRNAAMQAARGEIIYFLDDDSRPLPHNVRQAVEHFRKSPDVKMAGGPNVCPPEAPALEQIFAVVLGSWLAFGPSRARYAPVGEGRPTSEKELILCNLLARREDLLNLGGFDEALYPNEENALMDELQRRGGKLIYDPALMAYRRPRPTLDAFVRMLMTYGRGRAEQFRLHPTPGSLLNFVPPLFCLYLALLPLALLAPALRWWALVPCASYALAVAGQTIVSVALAGVSRGLLSMPLVVASHVFYGIGFWHGLFTGLKASQDKSPTDVQLECFSPDISRSA